MNQMIPSRTEIDINQRLAKTYYSNGRFTPLFIAVAGLGFIVIYFLTRLSILGEPAPQLLYLGGITLLLALAHFPILALAQQQRGIAAHLAGTLAVGIFALLLTIGWQGILPVAILISLITPVVALRSGLPRLYAISCLGLILAIVIAIVIADRYPLVERLQSDTPASIASIVFLGATVVLLLTTTAISLNSRFRTLQSLLLLSFLIIVAIPTVMTAILTAISAHSNTQAQTFKTLEAITTLKVNQMETILADSHHDAEILLSDIRFRTNTSDVLLNTALEQSIRENLKRIVRYRMTEILGGEEESYAEMMVLDNRGTVVISTLPEREHTSFVREAFFQYSAANVYAGFAPEALFGNENFVVAAPIYDHGSGAVQGILVLRSNGGNLNEILETTPGFTEAETYLVDYRFSPVTKTRDDAKVVNTEAALDAIRNHRSSQGIYTNYRGERVLGYYGWFEPMRVAVIAEVPLSYVVSSSLGSLAGSGILALFVVGMAIAAVAISARSIAEPIRTLAETTQSFASGRLSARAVVNRRDEIGALANAYNQMAAQLQEMISKLEQRVSDRTQDLENQTLRLRVAAEIARDAASARDLQQLLSETARLICDRFGFYHTGIFLLDANKEYAVLIASPTEPGRQMIESHHKLRVGETGIVGRVAATGEPRITLNTGSDAVYFNNPYLPETRSEMSLPLKVGHNVIGVLDVQSDQPEAFDQDDVAIMQILADQLAIAIERTRLLEEVERNLKELESAHSRFTSENWTQRTAGTLTGSRGYRFDRVRIEPLTEMPALGATAIQAGTIISSNGSKRATESEHAMAVPIKLRGQTIGVINLKLKDGYDRSTISVIELVTERLAAAMESARLYEEARLRADREQSISKITTAISSSTEYENILQTTVREIGSLLGDTEVSIQILEDPAADRRAEGREH